jgi:hypothetical protein
MAMEPITLFSRIADPAKVATKLRELSPTVALDGPDDQWRRAVVRVGEGQSPTTALAMWNRTARELGCRARSAGWKGA